MKNDIEIICDALVQFRNERDWQQFHTSKDLAIAISIEAAELNELFLWKKDEDEIDLVAVKDELADVFSFCFLLAKKHNLDIKEIILDKINKNAKKYPVEKSKGTSKKYDKL